jgi:ketosteroid isomerase-like protein
MVDTDDWREINDVLARYCWAVDEGDAEAYASLWTEDGVLTGMGPARSGHEALGGVASGVTQRFGRNMRHLYSNLVCDYAGDAQDEIHAKYYSYVSVWGAQARLFGMALCHATFVRQAGRWKIRSNNLEMLAAGAPA